jgi:hypothetical protein
MIPGNRQKQGAGGGRQWKRKFLWLKGKNDAKQIILRQLTPENRRGQSSAAKAKMQNSNFGLSQTAHLTQNQLAA